MKKTQIFNILIYVVFILTSCSGGDGKSKNNIPINMSIKSNITPDTVKNSQTTVFGKKAYKNEIFPKIKNLKAFQNTDFVLTLENKLPNEKNVIYVSSFLFAWAELKKVMKSPIIVDNSCSIDLKLLNQSNSYYGSLKKREYVSKSYIDNGKIYTKAYFDMSLPFISPFQSIDEGINFNNVKVKAFGIQSEDEAINNIEILYYKDSDHFVIKIKLKDENHELYLSKGLSLKGSFSNLITETNSLITIGKKEMNSKNKEFYQFDTYDILNIPNIKFNIENNYSELVNQKIISNNSTYIIDSACQTTTFHLDKYGVEVGGESAIYGSLGYNPDAKIFEFNKPFLIYLKRKDCKYPYLAIKVIDTELMIPI